MSFNPVATEGKVFEIPYEQMYDAVCSGVVACGWQLGDYQGDANKKNIVFLFFELNETNADGEPFVVFQKFNNTTSDKGKFKPFFEKMTKTSLTHEIDLSELIGYQVKALVTHSNNKDNTKTYANIDTALPNPAGQMTVTNPLIYDFEEHNEAVFVTLPKFMQNLVLNRMTAQEVADFEY